MLHKFSLDVAARLKELRWSVNVSYGPTRPAMTITKDAVVFSYDGATGDTFIDPSLCRTSEKPLFAIKRGCKFMVFSKTYKAAGAVWEHQNEAFSVAGQTLCAMRNVLLPKGAFKYEHVSRAGYLTQDQLKLEGLEAWPGVVYEVKFWLPTTIFERTWEDEPTQATGNVDDVENTLSVGE